MKNLNYQLKQLCRHNHDGRYATQQNRERMLSLLADQLHALSYRGLEAKSLKPKHVEALHQNLAPPSGLEPATH
ncbi:phage integrase N-terminal domain-containing protein [Chromatocurvus halotolerans]|uniref:phage integrase N-terminal domain-containing protein n=1 Tax=Chromatocurvus halotolerans TaxID=1132028 RepID=UPI000E3D497A